MKRKFTGVKSKLSGNLSGEEYQRMKDNFKGQWKTIRTKRAREKAQDEINKKTKLLNEEKDKSKLIDMDVKETQKDLINDLTNLLLKNSNKLTKSKRKINY